MKNDKPLPHRQLVEVWGDTVDVQHLAGAIVLGVGVSLAGFFMASRVLASHVSTPELARAYAMLAGLGGCLLSGILCTLLFKPKRVVVEGDVADPVWREEVLRQLAEQTGDLGAVADLPPSVVQEMKELQIYELFVAYEKSAAQSAQQALPQASAPPSHSAFTAQTKAA